jgi:hypothetical protein
VKSSIEKCGSLPFGAIVCLVFPDQGLNLLREKTAYRSLATCRQNFGFFEHLPTETHRYVSLVIVS